MKKINFTVFVGVTGANPNGDPLDHNQPRVDSNGFGLISDVALKRKLRDVLQSMGEPILVQSAENTTDDYTDIQARYAHNDRIAKATTTYKKEPTEHHRQELFRSWTESYFDVRAFGFVAAYKSTKDTDPGVDKTFSKLSYGIRGAVSIQQAKTLTPLDYDILQITKSANGYPANGKAKPAADGVDTDDTSSAMGRSSDTMGTKFSVPFAVYKFSGAVSPILAAKNGLTDTDFKQLREALEHLFAMDASAARPAGSMVVLKVLWYEQDSQGEIAQYALDNAVTASLPEGIPTLDQVVFDDSRLAALAQTAPLTVIEYNGLTSQETTTQLP